MRKALITGITGQDGLYLADFLIKNGYKVYGMIRPNSRRSLGTLEALSPELLSQIVFAYGDVTDPISVRNVVKLASPDEVYHLAGLSFVGTSWDLYPQVLNVNAMGTFNVLSAVLDHSRATRVFVASTGAVFGISDRRTQNESTQVNPCSPYGISKLAAQNIAKNFREARGQYVSVGICFNHESPFRSIEYLSRKVCVAAQGIKQGSFKDKLTLGSLSPVKDWGFVGDYIRAMHAVLQLEIPDDFVIATGQSYSVGDFVNEVFSTLDLDYQEHVVFSDKFARPMEIPYMCGDYSKLNRATGWTPTVDFKNLVKLLLDVKESPEDIPEIPKKEEK